MFRINPYPTPSLDGRTLWCHGTSIFRLIQQSHAPGRSELVVSGPARADFSEDHHTMDFEHQNKDPKFNDCDIFGSDPSDLKIAPRYVFVSAKAKGFGGSPFPSRAVQQTPNRRDRKVRSDQNSGKRFFNFWHYNISISYYIYTII